MTKIPRQPDISNKVQAIMDTPPVLEEVYQTTTFLDEGSFAVVCAVDDHWVIRASLTSKDGWRAITRISERMRERLNLPKVLFTWTELRSGEGCMDDLTPDERLTLLDPFPPHPTEGGNIEMSLVERLEKLETGVDYISIKRPSRLAPVYPGFPKQLCPTSPCYGVAKQAIRAHRVLKRMGLLTSPRIDISHRNIMKRKNGEYVLSDPFGYDLGQKGDRA